MKCNAILPGIVMLLVFAITPAAMAQDATIIHAIQSPAWVERGGRTLPARPGSPLRSGDLLRTGPGGRAQVDLPEGSRVKLGEDTEFRPTRLAERADGDGGFFDAAMDILKGAFRFTTGLAGQERRRTVDIRVGAVTVGIRGTDIWGRSGPDSDFVVLLEGRIEMSTDGMAPEVLTSPLDGRILRAGETRLAPMPDVTMDVVRELAPQTELVPEQGALTADGELQLVLASSRYPRGVEKIQAQLEAAGYPAYIEAVPVDGVMWHRVVIDNVASVDDGRELGGTLVGRYGINGYWLRSMN